MYKVMLEKNAVFGEQTIHQSPSLCIRNRIDEPTNGDADLSSFHNVPFRCINMNKYDDMGTITNKILKCICKSEILTDFLFE